MKPVNFELEYSSDGFLAIKVLRKCYDAAKFKLVSAADNSPPRYWLSAAICCFGRAGALRANFEYDRSCVILESLS
jgi:hypothetical protein